jgi:hypothetical protein
LVFTVEWYTGNCYSARDVPSGPSIDLDIVSVQEAFVEGIVMAQVGFIDIFPVGF